jgi:hypothetical protein
MRHVAMLILGAFITGAVRWGQGPPRRVLIVRDDSVGPKIMAARKGGDPVSGQMDDEVAPRPAPTEGLEHLDLEGTPQGFLEDQLVFGPGALAMHVPRTGRTVLGGRAPAAALG